MKTQRIALLPLLFAATLVGCGETTTQRISPAIVVELANPDAENPCGPSDEGRKEPALDFGDIPLDDEHLLALCVHSNTPAPLTLEGYEVDGDPVSGQDFGVSEPKAGTVISPRSSQLVQVRFSPSEAREYQATLQIASSDPRKPKFAVPLKGRGISSALRVLGCLPGKSEDGGDLCAATEVEAPKELDLGKVTIGSNLKFNVILDNRGRHPLVVNEVTFKDVEEAIEQGFILPTRPKFPFTLNALNGQGVGFTFQPPEGDERTVRATVVVRSEDRNLPEVELPVVVQVMPNTPPRACLHVSEVEAFMTGKKEAPEIDEEGVVTVSVMDLLHLDGRVREGCTGDDEDGTDLEIDMAFLENPDAYGQLRAGKDTLERTFQPERFTRGDEVYTVGLTATDKQGLVADADEEGVPAEVSFRVQPREDIAVEISWPEDAAGADVDLHFVRASTPPTNTKIGTPDDCHSGAASRDWGASQARLPISDSGNGSRTETLLMMYPQHNEKYYVYAHFFQDNRGIPSTNQCTGDADCAEGHGCASGSCRPYVEVHTRLFIQRQPVLDEVTARLLEPCDTFLIGTITWKDDPTGAQRPTFNAGGPISPGEGTRSGTSCVMSP